MDNDDRLKPTLQKNLTYIGVVVGRASARLPKVWNKDIIFLWKTTEK
jgi:hypothetical protein